MVFVPVQAKLKEKKLVVTSSFSDMSRTASTTTKNKNNQCAPSPTTLQPIEDSGDQFGRYSPTGHKHDSYALVSNQLYAAATRQQLFNTFVSTCIPQGAQTSGMSGNTRGGTWILQLPELLMRTPSLEASMSAISASVIGRMHNDHALVKESLKLYTIALHELQKALWNPKLMYDEETLAACLCLSLYEVIECPGDGYQAYYNHCKGCMRLVEARGIDRHLSGVAHELFLGFRAQGVSVSLSLSLSLFF
jgi:hypothetical protein